MVRMECVVQGRSREIRSRRTERGEARMDRLRGNYAVYRSVKSLT